MKRLAVITLALAFFAVFDLLNGDILHSLWSLFR